MPSLQFWPLPRGTGADSVGRENCGEHLYAPFPAHSLGDVDGSAPFSRR